MAPDSVAVREQPNMARKWGFQVACSPPDSAARRRPVAGTPPGRTTRRAAALAAAVIALALLLSGCADQKEKYCDAVKDHQQELGEVLGDGSPDALLKALPIFRDLADEAPDDLRDEWKTVIDALEGLERALDDAGVDPASYDRDNPPEGLSQADRDAIDAAARRLTSEQTAEALGGVDQQAKDVCGTPLQV